MSVLGKTDDWKPVSELVISRKIRSTRLLTAAMKKNNWMELWLSHKTISSIMRLTGTLFSCRFKPSHSVSSALIDLAMLTTTLFFGWIWLQAWAWAAYTCEVRQLKRLRGFWKTSSHHWCMTVYDSISEIRQLWQVNADFTTWTPDKFSKRYEAMVSPKKLFAECFLAI